jgi:L-2-hydroxyglutarate oxidase LhgO
MDSVECVVAGAGVIGLAVARALARAGREVVVVEAAEGIGTGTSARNSEVIHAGIYYEPGSLRARFCVTGRQALYAYCRDHDIAHRSCGKLIVAIENSEIEGLNKLARIATANGVTDLTLLSAAEAKGMEPGLECVAALWSPSTGIIDSHGYMLALRGDAEAAGASFAFHAPLQHVRREGDALTLDIGGPDPMSLSCRVLINAAGLSAPALAHQIDAMPREKIPQAYFAKGSYFSCTARTPFTRLIYPAPVAGGLGIHLTLDLAGQGRFGPDVEWLDTKQISALDYNVDAGRAAKFYTAIRRYWPALPDGALIPAYSGVRPKIVPPAVANQDFVIQSEADHGVRGLINLFGIESPGLTSSLAIADHVAAMAGAKPEDVGI